MNKLRRCEKSNVSNASKVVGKKHHCKLLDFPNEILILIFEKCHLLDITNLSFTCKRFYSVTTDNLLWKILFLKLLIKCKTKGGQMIRYHFSKAEDNPHLTLAPNLESDHWKKLFFRHAKQIQSSMFCGKGSVKNCSKILTEMGIKISLFFLDEFGKLLLQLSQPLKRSISVNSLLLHFDSIEFPQICKVARLQLWLFRPLLPPSVILPRYCPQRRSLLSELCIPREGLSHFCKTQMWRCDMASQSNLHLIALPVHGWILSRWKQDDELAFVRFCHSLDFINDIVFQGGAALEPLPFRTIARISPRKVDSDLEKNKKSRVMEEPATPWPEALYSLSLKVRLFVEVDEQRGLLFNNFWRCLDCQRESDGSYVGLLVDKRDRRTHQLFEQEPLLRWRTETFSGEIRNLAFLEILLNQHGLCGANTRHLEQRSKAFLNMSGPVILHYDDCEKSTSTKTVQEDCYDYEGGQFKFSLENQEGCVVQFTAIKDKIGCNIYVISGFLRLSKEMVRRSLNLDSVEREDSKIIKSST